MRPAIDTHHHLWDAVANTYPYLQDGSRDRLHGKPLPRRYLIDEFERDIAGTGVEGSVHIQCGWDPSSPVGETIWLDGIAARSGLPTAIVAHADLASPDVAAVLESHLGASARMRGIRQHVGWHDNPRYRLAPRPDMLEDPAWIAGFGMLARYNLSFELQAFYPQLAAAAACAERHPGVPMLLGNSGMPVDRGADEMKAWCAAVGRFARVPSAYVKLGGFAMCDPHWTAESIAPVVGFLIEAFGPRRCMIGSNFPVEGLHKSYGEVWSAFALILAGYSKAEQHEIFAGTARRVYRLDHD